MYRIFLTHQWKQFWRSRNKTTSIVLKVIAGFFILYFLVLALAAGFFIEKIIHEIFPGKNVVTIFNGFIIYFFMADFLLRIQLQELPTLSIAPYLPLRISRRKIVSFLNLKALFSVFNFLPLFIFLPFCFTVILKSFGSTASVMYAVSVISLAVFNNYVSLYLKRKSISNILYFIAGIAVIAVFGLLEYFKIISIAAAGDIIFSSIALHPMLGFGFTVLCTLIFVINSKYLYRNLYIDELKNKAEKKGSSDYPFLNRFGKVGDLVALEVKLIVRNKRPRKMVLLGAVFLVYGFLFYKSDYIAKNQVGALLFGSFIITNMSFINYGQFMFAWQSAHFDGLLSNKISLKNFIKAKFLLFTIICSAAFILCSLYGLMSWKLLVLQLATYLYTIGFGIVIILYFATMNYKRMDITSNARFNWQGSSYVQWVLSILLFLIPFLLYMPFSYFHLPYYGIGAVAFFGLVTLLMRNFWIELLTRKLTKQRYKIAEGFRE